MPRTPDGRDTNVYEYLEAVAQASAGIVEELYRDPGACRCIFEYLLPLAKQYVMRLVPCGHIWAELDAWLAEGAALRHHRDACSQLVKLRIMQKRASGDRGSGQSVKAEYCLHAGFRSQMLEWLGGSDAGQWHSSSSADPAVKRKKMAIDISPPTAEQLQREATGQWERILQFLLSGEGRRPSA